MADAERPELVPTAECEEGRVKVELPNGKWQLIATYRAGERPGNQEPEFHPKPKPQDPLPSPRVDANSSIEPYHRKLREVMRLSLNRGNLELLCADLGLGTEFVRNEELGRECQRIIDECKLSGRGKMGDLLYFLRSQRPNSDFPDLPPDEDPWWTGWTDGSRLNIYRHPAQKGRIV